MIPPEGETLEKDQQFPYIELQQKVYPNNLDKDNYLKALERLRRIMLLVIFLLKVSLYEYVRISWSFIHDLRNSAATLLLSKSRSREGGE
jgi:hypothetical protein